MTTITILDTGISKLYEQTLGNRIISKTTCYINDDKHFIIEDGADDEIGHGTLVCSAINMINKNIQYNFIKMCGENYWADENTLINTLKYIAEKNVKSDIIHISCGIQTCERLEELEAVLQDLKKRGIYIVSAFSNDRIVSYPAACSMVLGVAFDTSIVSPNNWIYVNYSIVNIFATGNLHTLTNRFGKKENVAGSSFAAAFITGHIAKMLDIYGKNEIDERLKESAIRVYDAPSFVEQPKPFDIQKIAVFPFNKENHALIRNYDMLKVEVDAVLENKFSPYIGKDAFELLSILDYSDEKENRHELIIKNIMQFDWSGTFDTFVLGHIGLLNNTMKNSLYDYIYTNCIRHGKNLFSYDPIPSNVIEDFHHAGLNCYYPNIIAHGNENSNCGMLYEISKPVIGVFGTSSKQGKWSLQLKMRRIFEEKGYSTGHLGTEPHGYLFKNTETCAIGYNSYVNMMHNEAIVLFNSTMHQLSKNSDILFFGAQSNTIQYAFGGLATIPRYTNEMIIACEPQASILCINEWDDIDFIQRTIKYLESFNGNKVLGLAYYFKNNRTQINNAGINKVALNRDYNRILEIEQATQTKIYDMDCKTEIEALCDVVESYFSESGE